MYTYALGLGSGERPAESFAQIPSDGGIASFGFGHVPLFASRNGGRHPSDGFRLSYAVLWDEPVRFQCAIDVGAGHADRDAGQHPTVLCGFKLRALIARGFPGADDCFTESNPCSGGRCRAVVERFPGLPAVPTSIAANAVAARNASSPGCAAGDTLANVPKSWSTLFETHTVRFPA